MTRQATQTTSSQRAQLKPLSIHTTQRIARLCVIWLDQNSSGRGALRCTAKGSANDSQQRAGAERYEYPTDDGD